MRKAEKLLLSIKDPTEREIKDVPPIKENTHELKFD
jgi:hypothetical protein